MLRISAVAVALSLIGGSALAEDAGPFDKWLSPDSAPCVSLSELKKDGAKIVKLTPDQFQFARALYVAIPPVSRKLPPAETAVEAMAGGAVMVALVTGDGDVARTCARFLAPDFIKTMLDDVATGSTGTVGQPL